MKTWTGKLLSWCYDWQQDHWVLYILLIRLQAVWFSFVLTYGGEYLHLTEVTDGKRSFTGTGIFITILLVLAVIACEISTRYMNKQSSNNHSPGAALILSNLRDATVALCDSKYNTLVNKIHNISVNNSRVPDIISSPEKQLDVLTSQMSRCLCQLLQPDKGEPWRPEDIFVSIAYEYPSIAKDEWHWATKERGLPLVDLFKEGPNSSISTMLHCLQNKGNRVFFNSKQDAFNQKCYLPDSEDEYDNNGNLLGSIACYEGKVKKNDVTYIHYILTISTYDKKFVSIDENTFKDQEEAKKARHNAEEAVKSNISKHIVHDFSIRAKIELCLLYLSDLKKKS